MQIFSIHYKLFVHLCKVDARCKVVIFLSVQFFIILIHEITL